MIAVEGLSVVYGRTLALDEMTVTFAEGITGLFGPNGSGKSTLLRCIAGLLRPTTGRVTILDQPTHPVGEALRARIGYAGHESGLYAHLTVAENLALFATLHGVEHERIAEAISTLGLGGYASTAAGALSAGLARRAAVARALLHDPDVLLLDEPYANLDDEAGALVSDAVVAWGRPGRAAIIATHGAKKVKAYASAGVILKSGRVAVAGTYRPPARV